MTRAIIIAAALAASLGPGVRIKEGSSEIAPPDRLSLDPKSPFYDSALINRGVGVRFKGVEIFNCAEYCVSEGWVRRIPVGGTYKSTVKLQGAVEVWFRS